MNALKGGNKVATNKAETTENKQTESDVDWATYSNGNVVETKDKVKLTKDEYKKAIEIKKMPWTIDYLELVDL